MERVEEWHRHCTYIWPFFKTHFHTVIVRYCTTRYHTYFASPLKGRIAIWSFLVLAGLGTNCLRSFLPTVEPPLPATKASSPTGLCVHSPLCKSNNCALPCSCSLPGPLESHANNIGGGESLYGDLGRKVRNSGPWASHKIICHNCARTASSLTLYGLMQRRG